MDNLNRTAKRSPDRITIKAGHHKTTMSLPSKASTSLASLGLARALLSRRPCPASQADLHRIPAPKRRRAQARLVTVKCGHKSSTSLVTLRPDRTYLLRLPHPAPALSTLAAEARRPTRYLSPELPR